MTTDIAHVHGTIERPMPHESPREAPTSQETWLSWLPPGVPEPDVQLRRSAFLELLARNGVEVTEGSLRFWERAGVLPRAVRRWDAESRTSRSYYALFMAPIVIILRELQDAGHTLHGIAPNLRVLGAEFAASFHEHLEKQGRYQAFVDQGSLDAFIRMSVPAALFYLLTFPALKAHIDVRERYFVTATKDVEITFVDMEGRRETAKYGIRDGQGQPSFTSTPPEAT